MVNHKLQTLSSDTLSKRLAVLVSNLKPYEMIEIKLNENKKGEISIIIKSNYKEVLMLENN